MSDARRSRATDPSTDTTAGDDTDNSSRRPPSSRRNARSRPSPSRADVDQTEGLGDAAVGGDQRRDRSRTAVERVVAAQHPRAPDGEWGEGAGNGVAAQVAWRVDAYGAPRAACDGAAQRRLGRRRADGRDRDERVPASVARECERELEGGLVGGRHPGPAVVIVGCDPLPAHEHVHVRLKTTP